jgi:methionine synthase I (cobalamin-dependent)
MSRLQSWLTEGPLITDGAWGTEFQKLGLAPGVNPDAWNLERPEAVLSVAASYAEAGSQLILTNTFRANSVAMPDVDPERLEAINSAGVALSRQAADGRCRVVASIGPSGKVLMLGEVAPEQIYESFAAQARALAAASPDALLIETMSDPEEAEIALRAARETGLPVILSFAFDSGRNKDRTMMGSTPEQIVDRFRGDPPDALGANCGAGVEFFAAVCRRLAPIGCPIWIKANAGLPTTNAAGELAYATRAEEFASYLPGLLEASASFVGGCCGTSPEFVRALVAARA